MELPSGFEPEPLDWSSSALTTWPQPIRIKKPLILRNYLQSFLYSAWLKVSKKKTEFQTVNQTVLHSFM